MWRVHAWVRDRRDQKEGATTFSVIRGAGQWPKIRLCQDLHTDPLTPITDPLTPIMPIMTPNGYQNTIAILPASAAGQNVQLKWRMATDNSTAAVGVRIDDVSVRALVCRDVGPPLA